MVGVPVVVHLVLRPLADAMELPIIGQVQWAALGLCSVPGNEPVISLSQHPLQLIPLIKHFLSCAPCMLSQSFPAKPCTNPTTLQSVLILFIR